MNQHRDDKKPHEKKPDETHKQGTSDPMGQPPDSPPALPPEPAPAPAPGHKPE